MPPRMSGSPSSGGSIEQGNRLGSRPFTRQSQFYREGNSGNAVKGLLGQDNLSWDMTRQEGAFAGQPVYDGRAQQYAGMQQQQQQQQRQQPPNFQMRQQQFSSPQPPQQQQQRKGVSFPQGMMAPSRDQPFQLPPTAGAYNPPPAPQEEAEYPLPGSVAACDSCGTVVNRYYHCTDCQEATGLFDLCVQCCAAMYLKGGKKLAHPSHDYQRHCMEHVIPLPTGASRGAGSAQSRGMGAPTASGPPGRMLFNR